MKMTQSEYGAHCGISQPRVSAMIKSGKIPKEALVKVGKYTKIDSELADAALKKNLDPAQKIKANSAAANSATGSPASRPAPLPGPVPVNIEKNKISFEQARTRNEIIKSELNMLKLKIEKGELVEAEKVTAQAFRAGRIIRDAIESIPVRVAAAVAAETVPFKCQQILVAEFKHVLNNLVETLGV